jgi:hypothetical protein
MSTLNTLQSFIDNAKQTPSGKVEWTDTSLKGLQDEVKHLFATNAVQTTPNTGNLITLSGNDSLLAIVENDTTLSKNGIYFWSLSPVVIGYTYAAAGGGYWNFVRNPTTSPVTKIVAGTNVTISPAGGTGDVTINSQSTAINASNYSVPTRLNATTFINSNIYDDTNITKTASSGFRFNYSAYEYLFGDYSNGNGGTTLFIDDSVGAIKTLKNASSLGLNIDYGNDSYQLGDFDNLTFGTNISIYNNTNYISIIANASNDARIDIDGISQITNITNNVNKIGGNTTRTYLTITDSSSTIATQYANNPLGLTLSMANRRFTLGDTGSNNGAKLFIDDINKTVLLTAAANVNNTRVSLNDATQTFQIDATNLVVNSTTNNVAGRNPTGRYLNVTIGGTAYNIPLWI